MKKTSNLVAFFVVGVVLLIMACGTVTNVSTPTAPITHNPPTPFLVEPTPEPTATSAPDRQVYIDALTYALNQCAVVVAHWEDLAGRAGAYPELVTDDEWREDAILTLGAVAICGEMLEGPRQVPDDLLVADGYVVLAGQYFQDAAPVIADALERYDVDQMALGLMTYQEALTYIEKANGALP